MKNKVAFLAAVALAAFVTGPAMAADLSVKSPVYKAPAMPVAAHTWTGCYLGGNVGYGWAHKQWNDPINVPIDVGSSTSTGAVVGGQLGCDYQTGAFVFGVQGMWDWADLDGSHPYTGDTRYTDHSKVSSIATLTGRVGYLVQPATLLYVKGGAAWVRDKFTETCSTAVDTCPGVAKATRNGWLIGGGVEYAFMPNWSTFVEFNYMDFDRKRATLVYTDGATYNYDIKQDVKAVMVGINYRFGR